MLRVVAAAAAIAATVCGARAEDKVKPPSIWQQNTLTGDWGGARSALKDRGVEIVLDYIAETFSVLSGGLYRRTSFEGRLDLTVDADFDKLV